VNFNQWWRHFGAQDKDQAERGLTPSVALVIYQYPVWHWPSFCWHSIPLPHLTFQRVDKVYVTALASKTTTLQDLNPGYFRLSKKQAWHFGLAAWHMNLTTTDTDGTSKRSRWDLTNLAHMLLPVQRLNTAIPASTSCRFSALSK